MALIKPEELNFIFKLQLLAELMFFKKKKIVFHRLSLRNKRGGNLVLYLTGTFF